jgi:hypothetical protein
MSIWMPRVFDGLQHNYCVEASIELDVLVIRIERTSPNPRNAQPSPPSGLEEAPAHPRVIVNR